MNAEKRGFITFVSLGLLTAAGVGVGVWHASSPKPASVVSQGATSSMEQPTSEASTTSETHSEKPTDDKSDGDQDRDRKKSGDDEVENNAAAGNRTGAGRAPGMEDDPFLAPHARVNTEKREVEPTYY